MGSTSAASITEDMWTTLAGEYSYRQRLILRFKFSDAGGTAYLVVLVETKGPRTQNNPVTFPLPYGSLGPQAFKVTIAKHPFRVPQGTQVCIPAAFAR